MSHPLNSNRVMVSEVVDAKEETALDEAVTSKAQVIRPSPSNSPSLRLATLNLPLLSQLRLLTPSSSGTSHPPPSLSHLCCPHHSTQALTRLCLWCGGLV